MANEIESARLVLVIEDDEKLSELLARHLTGEGFQVEQTGRGLEAVTLAQQKAFSLIILDWNLPDSEGIEVCQQLREFDPLLPILMLTSRAEELDKVTGLRSGADDYVTKPFHLSELQARIDALLRRVEATRELTAGAVHSEDLLFPPLRVNAGDRRVYLSEQEVPLTAREFDVLVYLAQNRGKVVTRQQILSAVWDSEFEGYEQSVATMVKRLRKKLESVNDRVSYIETVRGVGYRFLLGR